MCVVRLRSHTGNAGASSRVTGQQVRCSSSAKSLLKHTDATTQPSLPASMSTAGVL